ncbi:hypothetical protein CBR_g48479 [Chara braunii]|uniref:Uncharacterized protein n=1 Tax=Chara braunii TaxID=69332 RepID=A0A388M2R2_CHABU|nr:hypothetical protein CBR_g48479 [Chara braunii]|eukprot:GBG88867.1 hypothetical protein CBR_g48479 [Chara braunii]
MYMFGTLMNAQSLEVDPDGVTEFQAHEVGMWFLLASRLCKDEGGDAETLHRDIMMIAEYWAEDHSRCIGERQLLCEKGGRPGRLSLYTRDDSVYEIVVQLLGKHCSTKNTVYYTELRHASTVNTFQGTMIIYTKKFVHFEKSIEAQLAIAVIRWNSHACTPLDVPAGTSIHDDDVLGDNDIFIVGRESGDAGIVGREVDNASSSDVGGDDVELDSE